MQTEELSGFAKVLADWTQQATKLNCLLADHDDIGTCLEELNIVAVQMQRTAAVFEQLMGVDAPVPPEAARVLFCAAPQLGTVIGRTIGNGDARYDVKLASGHIITVPSDFIGGAEAALCAWAEARGKVGLTPDDVRATTRISFVPTPPAELKRRMLPSPDGKR